jgi:CheY-like chemotaxis protein
MGTETGSSSSVYAKLTKSYEPKFYLFHDLMTKRINDILLVSSLYDNFILEEDGRITEKLFELYSTLNLSAPPRFHRVSSPREALELIEEKKKKFDLIITMRRLADMDPFEFAKSVKKTLSSCPVVLLLNNAVDVKHLEKFEDKKSIDRIFLWTGDSELLLAIIKLFEDLLNADLDTKKGKIQVLILVENSIRYYSIFLPMLYSEVMKQTQKLLEEGLNEYHRLLRMRARPKVLLAESYEEGLDIFNKYKDHILGIISDVAYPRNGKLDPNSGVDFIKEVKKYNLFYPSLLMSSQKENAIKAESLNASFIYKNSPIALQELRNFLITNLGFGDFVFRLSDGIEVGRASNLDELLVQIAIVPEDSLYFHASNNHFSNWLMARGEFSLAYKLRPIKISEFKDLEIFRIWIDQTIVQAKLAEQKGVIIDFGLRGMDSDEPDASISGNVWRIGSGSLGGKGRGIAFLDTLLILSNFGSAFNNVKILIPETFVISTDEFDKFIGLNRLYRILSDNATDEFIVKRFLEAKLPDNLLNNLMILIKKEKGPLAVRSSSLLEDSQFQPFAGIYKTYMLPNNHPNPHERFEQLCHAVKLVYASSYLQLPRDYMESIGLKIEEEKMAVVIQKLVGTYHNNDDWYFPDFSGVLQSYNFYPVSYLTPEDGIAHVALGLGKTIVEGEKALRFCPKYPEILPQFSKPKDVLDNSQNSLYILDTSRLNLPDIQTDESATLKKLGIKDIENFDLMYKIGSKFDPNDNIVRDGMSSGGITTVNFAGVLKFNQFPKFTEILHKLNIEGTAAMGCPIEIEFTVNFKDRTNKIPTLYLLQIRPLVTEYEVKGVTIDKNSKENAIYSSFALGNTTIKDIKDILIVDPNFFNNLKTREIMKEISDFNEKMKISNTPYILIGPGRWGSNDPMLGIPVKWSDISGVRVIIEYGMEEFNIDPSYGTHFFSNLTALQIVYLTVPYETNELLRERKNYIDWQWLNGQKIKEEKDFVKHISLEKSLYVKSNGRSREGVVMKSEA